MATRIEDPAFSAYELLAPFYDLYIEAAKAVGIPYNTDYSGARQEGIAMAQQTAARGMRHSTATQYLQPARRRSILSLALRGKAGKVARLSFAEI